MSLAFQPDIRLTTWQLSSDQRFTPAHILSSTSLSILSPLLSATPSPLLRSTPSKSAPFLILFSNISFHVSPSCILLACFLPVPNEIPPILTLSLSIKAQPYRWKVKSHGAVHSQTILIDLQLALIRYTSPASSLLYNVEL